MKRLIRGPAMMLDQLLDLRRYVDHPTINIPIASHTAGFHRYQETVHTPASAATHPIQLDAAPNDCAG